MVHSKGCGWVKWKTFGSLCGDPISVLVKVLEQLKLSIFVSVCVYTIYCSIFPHLIMFSFSLFLGGIRIIESYSCYGSSCLSRCCFDLSKIQMHMLGHVAYSCWEFRLCFGFFICQTETEVKGFASRREKSPKKILYFYFTNKRFPHFSRQ